MPPPPPPLHVVVNAVQRQSSSSTSLHFFLLLLFFSSFIFLPFFSSLLVSLLSFYFFQNGKIGGGLRRERSPITVSLGNAQIRKALASRRISCKDFRITAPPPGRQDFRGSPSQKLTVGRPGRGMLRYKSGRRRSKSNHSWFYRDRANDMFQTRKKKKKNFYATRVYAMIPYMLSRYLSVK